MSKIGENKIFRRDNMKKIMALLLLVGVLIFAACELNDPTEPEITTVKPGELALFKVVFVGSSLTAGFQSGGLVEDLQVKSFPSLIYHQMGQGSLIEQPLINDPGISSTPGFGVLDFNPATGEIAPRGTYTDPRLLLNNATLGRPYDNLGVPGAKLKDVLETFDGSGGNPFFDLILRNPNFGNTTQVQQAQLLAPTLVVVWIGSNDVLGAALDGGDSTLITPVAQFQQDYGRLLQELAKIRDGKAGIILLNIPNITDIPYVNILDGTPVYQDLGFGPQPVVFQSVTDTLTGLPKVEPVNFDPTGQTTIYLPLLTEEGLATTGSPIEHLLLPFVSEYADITTPAPGVPDSAAMVDILQIPPPLASQIQAGMINAGLIPSGTPIAGSLTITEAEEAVLIKAVEDFNNFIESAANANGIPWIDAKAKLEELNQSGIEGYTGSYVLFDPANTAFSLDGVHPNNGGYAIFAKEIINLMNQFPDIDIPPIDIQQFKGQYTGGSSFPKSITYKAAIQAKAIFTDY
jgi:lysophospholipase L1-like esterase